MFVIFTPIWGRFPFFLTNMFQVGWNHQPVLVKRLHKFLLHFISRHFVGLSSDKAHIFYIMPCFEHWKVHTVWGYL